MLKLIIIYHIGPTTAKSQRTKSGISCNWPSCENRITANTTIHVVVVLQAEESLCNIILWFCCIQHFRDNPDVLPKLLWEYLADFQANTTRNLTCTGCKSLCTNTIVLHATKRLYFCTPKCIAAYLAKRAIGGWNDEMRSKRGEEKKEKQQAKRAEKKKQQMKKKSQKKGKESGAKKKTKDKQNKSKNTTKKPTNTKK